MHLASLSGADPEDTAEGGLGGERGSRRRRGGKKTDFSAFQVSVNAHRTSLDKVGKGKRGFV